MRLRMIAARVSLGWIEAWQVDPDQLEIALHHLTDMEGRVARGDGQMADFHFNAPVMAVGAAILALCDAFGVERFDRYLDVMEAIDPDLDT